MDAKIKRRQIFIVNTAYIALVAMLFFLAAKFLVPWLLPFILGWVIAMFFKPVVKILTDRCGLGPKLAGFLVVVFTYAAIILLLIWGGARIASVFRSVFAGLPYYYENTLEPAIRAIGRLINDALGLAFPGVDGYQMLALTLEDFRSALLALSSAALNFLGTLGARIPGFLLALFFTIMSSLIISMNYRQVSRFFVRQIPLKYRPVLFKIKSDTIKAVANYFLAYIKIMGVTFIELSVGFAILGVRNPVIVALAVAVFDIFPVFGVGGILIPWALIEVARLNLPMALGLVVLYLIVAIIRGFIEPRIIGRQLGLHPLVTLCAIYAGFQLMGVLGMIFFPILAQILVGLHRSGVIILWRSPPSS